jgi:hypothetical protein
VEAIEDITQRKLVSLFLHEDVLLEQGDTMRGKVRAQLQQSLRLMRAFNKVRKVCSPRSFENAEWIYADNYFAENIDFAQLDAQYTQEKWSSHALYFAQKDRMQHLLARHRKTRKMYEDRIHELQWKEKNTGVGCTPEENYLIQQYTQKLQSNALNPLSFDADPRIAHAMSLMTRELILGDIEMDEASKINIQKAMEISRKTGKKLIFNCNHAGHSDSYVIQQRYDELIRSGTIWGKWLPPEELKILRFLGWFYMTVTPWVRHYHMWINSVTVPWLNDMDGFNEGLGPRGVAEVFSHTFQWWKADAHKEIGVIFSQWWRGDYGGLKHEHVEWTKRYFSEDTIVVDIHFTNTDKIYEAMANKVTTFHRRSPQKVSVAVSEPYIWNTKNAKEIFASMVSQRDAMQPERKWAEKIHAMLQEIENNTEKVSILSKNIADSDIPDILFLQNHSSAIPDFIAQKQEHLMRMQEEYDVVVSTLAANKKLYAELLASWEVGERAAAIAL